MSRSIMYQREVAMMTSTVKEFLAKEGSGGSEPFPGAKTQERFFSVIFFGGSQSSWCKMLITLTTVI